MNLPRVLEPELTETDDEANAYDEMDHGVVNRQFVDDLIAATNLNTVEQAVVQVLDLGTGTARIPVELCNQTEDHVRVYAVDLSIPMLDLARLNVEFSSHVQRIQLDHMDVKQLDIDNPDGFDIVMSNSLVHHQADPGVCIAEAVRLTAVGGNLFFRDLARPDSEADIDALVGTYAAEEPPAAQKMFRESLFAALALGEIRAIIEGLGFDPQSVQMTSDRHWTWSAKKAV